MAHLTPAQKFEREQQRLQNEVPHLPLTLTSDAGPFAPHSYPPSLLASIRQLRRIDLSGQGPFVWFSGEAV